MLSIRRLAPTFAAEVRGIDATKQMAPAEFAELNSAVMELGVVVLPDQAVTIAQQIEFSRNFGPLWELPVKDIDQRRIKTAAISDVSNVGPDDKLIGTASERFAFLLGNQLWHSDLSFWPTPAQASILHATEVVTSGGETEFADILAAYDELPAATKGLIEGRIAWHSLLHSRAVAGYTATTAEQRATFPPAPQPLVRVHAETGRKALFVSAHAFAIEDMPDSDAQSLLAELMAHATQDRFVYRHRWRVNDLVIYDNRRALHRGRPYDADRERRVMHRTTIAGVGPTVENGRVIVGR